MCEAKHADLITLLDNAVRECSGRDIISTGEMVDMLLDMRLLLMTTDPETQLEGVEK
jgi:hypothetical protein